MIVVVTWELIVFRNKLQRYFLLQRYFSSSYNIFQEFLSINMRMLPFVVKLWKTMRWANEGPMSKMTWVRRRQTKVNALVQRWANACMFAGDLHYGQAFGCDTSFHCQENNGYHRQLDTLLNITLKQSFKYWLSDSVVKTVTGKKRPGKKHIGKKHIGKKRTGKKRIICI